MNQKAHKPTLTWEDCAGVMDAFFDYMNDIASGRATAQHTKEGLGYLYHLSILYHLFRWYKLSLHTRFRVCNKIISYIDSIVKESGDCIYGRQLEERKRVCKFCSAACLARLNEPFEILAEKVVMDETPAPEDFEPIDTGDLIFYDETKMAASKYAEKEKEREPDEVSDLAVKDIRKDFIAGANWKEEQLLSTAVDGVIVGTPYELYAESDEVDLTKFKAGERVKIIIIKDDGTGKLRN